MQFSMKLNFLMNITNTSNKELAEGISVDRSLISLLRNGKRKMPRNHEHIHRMASFFARRCPAEFQLHALSEMIGKPELRKNISAEALTEQIYCWMLGDAPVLERVLENLNAPMPDLDLPSDPPLLSVPTTQEGQTQFFYGNEGKREATRQVIKIAKQIGIPGSVYFISDVNLEWLFEDYQFMNDFSAALTCFFKNGFTLYHIVPSLNFMNRYVESLRYWLPIYASGQARAYYYPRLRDNLYRRSLMIIPGYCVQTTTSIGDETDLITCNSTDPQLVSAFEKQFQQELALCRPALTSHHDPHGFSLCLRELLSCSSSVIHKTARPSPYTLPPEFLDVFIEESTDPAWKECLQMHREDIHLFEEKLKHHQFIELCPLASPGDIRAGKVLFGVKFKTADQHPVYTPEAYAAHLQHILKLMDTYDNYCFIPINSMERQDYNLFCSEYGLTLLLGNSYPPFMLEFRRPELSQACHEYLMRMADLVGYTGIQRAKIRMKIKELIQELRD